MSNRKNVEGKKGRSLLKCNEAEVQNKVKYIYMIFTAKIVPMKIPSIAPKDSSYSK